MSKKSATFIKTIIGLLVLSLIVTVVLTQNSVKAETINETDPDLKLELIDGVKHTPDPKPEGNAEKSNNLYSVETNAEVMWSSQDDVAFLCKKYNVGGGSKDTLTCTTTLISQNPVTGLGGEEVTDNSISLHNNASAGIMMRTSLDNNCAEVYLHVRKLRVMMVYRMMDGSNTSTCSTSIVPFYPIELKLEKTGNSYSGYYRSPGTGDWILVGTCTSLIRGQTYAGLASYTCDTNKFSKVVYSGFSVSGEGTGTAESSEEGSESEVVSSEPIPEDAPIDKDVLMSETFSDGNLYDGEESITNPIWRSIFNNKNIVKSDDGLNRFWNIDFEDIYAFAGDENWTDYKTSLQLQFTKTCDMNSINLFELYVRHREVEFSGVNDYGISIETANKTNEKGIALKDPNGNTLKKNVIKIYKRTKTSAPKLGTQVYQDNVLVQADLPLCLGDEIWHTLDVTSFDNLIKINWDGVNVINYEDKEGNVNSRGCIGIRTQTVSVNIDNIVVKKLDDKTGGDYDNDVGGLWDQPTPSYVDGWLDKYFSGNGVIK